MRVLLLGGSGLLGTDLREAFARHETIAPSRSELDLTHPDAVASWIRDVDVVVNAAAFTAVDDAETDEATAFALNAAAAGSIASAAAATGARLVQISTDYVFDGTAQEPVPEDANPNPATVYGRSKAAGEAAVRLRHPAPHIVRTAWLYGSSSRNFVTTILQLLRRQETISVVTDQVGQPTWSADVATRVALMIDENAPAGTYHATNAGRASWFDFARAIASHAELDPERILPTVSASFPRPAPRPAFSVLGHDAWRTVGFPPMRDWRDALADAAAQGVLNAA